MSKLANDWGGWAADCAARHDPVVAPATEFTLTATILGRTVFASRIDLETGNEILADVVPLFGGSR